MGAPGEVTLERQGLAGTALSNELWEANVTFRNRGSNASPAFSVLFYAGHPQQNGRLISRNSAGPIPAGKTFCEGTAPFVLRTSETEIFAAIDPENVLKRPAESVEWIVKTPVADSRHQALRERAVQTWAQDRGKYTAQQLREAEALYLVANRKWGTPEAKQSLQKLIDEFPDLTNRTGCAVLYLAQMSQGDERTRYFQECIDKYNDCFYDDGVQVGAYARFLLAQDYKRQGETDKAHVLFDEIKSKYADAIDHAGSSLVDSLRTDSK